MLSSVTFAVTAVAPLIVKAPVLLGFAFPMLTSTTIEDDSIFWQNGGSITIGALATPSTFNIGTDAAVPAGDLWTGFTISDNWSVDGNWQDGSAPTVADEVIFSDLDAGSTNVVDTNFEIASLHYTGEGGHFTDLAGGSTLQVSGSRR